MLVISRKSGESIHIGGDVILQVTAIKGGRVQIGITAPREVSIRRSELTAHPEPTCIDSLCIEKASVENLVYRDAVA